MGKANFPECFQNLGLLIEVCHKQGVPLKWQKLEGPTTILTFLVSF